jgi:fructose-bisphosphate aldolase class 1
MNEHALIDTAKTLVAGDKGLLAMDESNPTCNKRFARLGIPHKVLPGLTCSKQETVDEVADVTNIARKEECPLWNPMLTSPRLPNRSE